MNQAGREHHHDIIGGHFITSSTGGVHKHALPRFPNFCFNPIKSSSVAMSFVLTDKSPQLPRSVNFERQVEPNSRSKQSLLIQKPLMKTSIHKLSFVALFGVAVTLTQQASAQTATWSGAGADQNWSTAG